MARQAAVMLPDIPRELQTAADKHRAKAKRLAARKRREGYLLVSAVVHGDEIAFLMQEWGFKDRAEMVRVALRYLAAQTRGGLTSITVPESHHNGDV